MSESSSAPQATRAMTATESVVVAPAGDGPPQIMQNAATSPVIAPASSNEPGNLPAAPDADVNNDAQQSLIDVAKRMELQSYLDMQGTPEEADHFAPAVAFYRQHYEECPPPTGWPTPSDAEILRSLAASRIARQQRAVDGTDRYNSSNGDIGSIRSGGQSSAETLAPRPDRAGQTVTGENAQGVYLPQACIFVANLSTTHSDADLAAAVEKVCEKYGTVYVKIRRDRKMMPFAFAQFEEVVSAAHALIGVRGSFIHGRPCRTEICRADRVLYLISANGTFVSQERAQELLSRFGPIVQMWPSSYTEREIFKLQQGVWVKFGYYQDYAEALEASLPARTAFRGHSSYRLFYPSNMGPTGPTVPGRNLFNYDRTRLRSRNAPRYQQHLSNEERTRRSVYVGNLPQRITKDALAAIFAPMGQINSIIIVERERLPFGFVEFDLEENVPRAIDEMNQTEFEGHTLLVQAKNSIGQPQVRRAPRGQDSRSYHLGRLSRPGFHATSTALGNEPVAAAPAMNPDTMAMTQQVAYLNMHQHHHLTVANHPGMMAMPEQAAYPNMDHQHQMTMLPPQPAYPYMPNEQPMIGASHANTVAMQQQVAYPATHHENGVPVTLPGQMMATYPGYSPVFVRKLELGGSAFNERPARNSAGAFSGVSAHSGGSYYAPPYASTPFNHPYQWYPYVDSTVGAAVGSPAEMGASAPRMLGWMHGNQES
ncbi:MAG: hypothetical protein M1826_001132 [Phylliscum demangeonii]|nr:MAG: hypothetical protein M1826_001132 [Phylliscum demangeonii]